jgi:hypothetical protein
MFHVKLSDRCNHEPPHGARVISPL